MVRVETAPFSLGGGVKAPALGRMHDRDLTIGNNHLYYFSNNPFLWR